MANLPIEIISMIRKDATELQKVRYFHKEKEALIKHLNKMPKDFSIEKWADCESNADEFIEEYLGYNSITIIEHLNCIIYEGLEHMWPKLVQFREVLLM